MCLGYISDLERKNARRIIIYPIVVWLYPVIPNSYNLKFKI